MTCDFKKVETKVTQNIVHSDKLDYKQMKI